MNIFNKIKKVLKLLSKLELLENIYSNNQVLLGKILSNQNLPETKFTSKIEFSVFSQFGDDGIIQFLLNNIGIKNKIFIEFGVENYKEANTRFLLLNNNWKGLIIDGNQDYINSISSEDISWRYDLTALCSFITKDNINQLFQENHLVGEIGLLSIDIDGNDYWVWKNISVVKPVIVIVEYNSVFGPDHAITIPYDPKFRRKEAHNSYLYWGCSLKALCMLAEKKGYAFIGSNSNGNNAYFVRKEQLGSLLSVSCEQGYVKSKFRESRDANGNLSFLSDEKRLHAIKDMQIYDLEKQSLVQISNLFGI